MNEIPLILFGGPSPEHDISILTGLQAARTLTDGGREVAAVYWSKAGLWFEVDPLLEAADFADGQPSKAKPLAFQAEHGGGFHAKRKKLEHGVIVNCCHGGPGEDGTLQAAFDLAGLQYTGPSAAASALGMDKLAFGAVVEAAGLPSLRRLALRQDPDQKIDFDPPFIVKPRFGGSSIGIEVVEDVVSARLLARTSPYMKRGAVIEPFLAGSRDIMVAVRTYPELQLSALESPVRETAADDIYSFKEKYLSGGGLEGSARELPADLPEHVEVAIRSAAEVVADVLPVRSVARLDFLRRETEVWVNEINTIPGSLAAYLWIDPPLSRFQLLSDVITEAAQHPAREFSAVGADGTALRSAAAISKKLG